MFASPLVDKKKSTMEINAVYALNSPEDEDIKSFYGELDVAVQQKSTSTIMLRDSNMKKFGRGRTQYIGQFCL